VSWAAVRGSVTLATALSVPLLTSAGGAFPERELVVFLAAATIVLTLALNGIPLPWLIVRLKAPSEADGLPEENAARAEIARAGADAVRPVLQTLSDPGQRTFVEQLIHRYEGKITLRGADAERVAEKAEHIAYARTVRLAGIAAEREALYRLHARDAINDETLRIIEEELDAYEMLSSASPLRG
jgi:CPA1 family monovalent cation:H+ antiporter